MALYLSDNGISPKQFPRHYFEAALENQLTYSGYVLLGSTMQRKEEAMRQYNPWQVTGQRQVMGKKSQNQLKLSRTGSPAFTDFPIYARQ